MTTRRFASTHGIILVDTSVWIDYFRGNDNVPVRKLENVLSRSIPFGITPHIYQEILQGAASPKDFKRLKRFLETQTFYLRDSPKQSYEEAALLYCRCRKAGVIVRSSVHCLICQTAIENEVLLLHNDADFTHIAKVITTLEIY